MLAYDSHDLDVGEKGLFEHTGGDVCQRVYEAYWEHMHVVELRLNHETWSQLPLVRGVVVLGGGAGGAGVGGVE